jgi:hypothetical protein
MPLRSDRSWFDLPPKAMYASVTHAKLSAQSGCRPVRSPTAVLPEVMTALIGCGRVGCRV